MSECLQICRICLETGTHVIKLDSKNELPSLICNKCVEELTVAWEFRNKCISFEERFATFSKNISKSNNLQNRKFENIVKIEDDINKYKLAAIDVAKNVFQTNLSENSNNSGEDSTINASDEKLKQIELKCSDCNKTLKTQASLLKHKVSMHQKRKHQGKVTGFGVNRCYHCNKCSYSTPHSQTLINHLRRHNGERPYHCNCGKSFTQSSSLAAHRKIHSGDTYYTCSKCGKQFKHAFSLKTHLFVHETGQFTCHICKKVLKSKQSFHAHMQRHYNIHNYSCEDCGKTFVTCSELLNHKKKHNSIKSVECHLCGYKTQTKKNLVVHLKRHAGDKPYECELCVISFYTKSDLQRHKRVHTREKPYTCSTCGQRFTHSPSLNKHMQTVHGVEYKWADVKMKELRKIKLVLVNEKKE